MPDPALETPYSNRQEGARRRTPQHQSMYDTGGRIMPQDKEVEEAVLGALMLEKDAYTTVCATF